jgi:hypothetical protein
MDLVIAPYLVLTNKDKTIGYASETFFNYRMHEKGSLSNNTSIANALNSISKGKNINELILHFMALNNAPSIYIERRKLILMEYDYLNYIYSNKRFAACKSFFLLSKTLWLRKKMMKELKRIFLTLVLGPKVFLFLKNRFI